MSFISHFKTMQILHCTFSCIDHQHLYVFSWVFFCFLILYAINLLKINPVRKSYRIVLFDIHFLTKFEDSMLLPVTVSAKATVFVRGFAQKHFIRETS